MNRSEYITIIKKGFNWPSSSDWNSFFMNHEFSSGVIDYERLACRDFFTGKLWHKIDVKSLAENHFYPGCLTDEGYINFFPAILLAALHDEQGMAEQTLFFRVTKLDSAIIQATNQMTPKDREMFLDIIDMWGNEDQSSFENNSLLKILQFKEIIEK